jgi:C4-dicarboxylate-specific signal transduction histidine kinase
MNVMAGVLVHELGQPITTQHLDATVALKLLESGRLDPEQAHVILTSIATAAGRASDIATAIRQLLQTRALRREPVALDALVARMVSRVFADTDTGGGTRLEVAVAHETVLGDAILLQQVIFNLLLNAREAIERVKERRGVVAIRSDRDGPSMVRLEVIDNGPGIAPDVEDRVFEPFFTSKQGGLGIGLSLCRLIVESHGGTLEVGRGIEGGARFVARLPIVPSEPDGSAGNPQLIGFARASLESSGASSRGPS